MSMNSGIESDFDGEYDERSPVVTTAWWVACPARMLVWARLQVRESGVGDVLDCDGQVLVYDSEDTARAALMDAEFRALDGLDDDDVAGWGILLEDLIPPEGDHDDDLVPRHRPLRRRARRCTCWRAQKPACAPRWPPCPAMATASSWPMPRTRSRWCATCTPPSATNPSRSW